MGRISGCASPTRSNSATARRGLRLPRDAREHPSLELRDLRVSAGACWPHPGQHPKSTGAERYPRPADEQLEVTELVPGRRLVLAGDLGPLHGTITYALEPTAGGTRLTNDAELEASGRSGWRRPWPQAASGTLWRTTSRRSRASWSPVGPNLSSLASFDRACRRARTYSGRMYRRCRPASTRTAPGRRLPRIG